MRGSSTFKKKKKRKKKKLTKKLNLKKDYI